MNLRRGELGTDSYAGRITALLVGAGYIYSPVAVGLYLRSEQEAGAFPVDADSIAIPMAGFLMLWILGWFFFGICFIGLNFWKRSCMQRDRNTTVDAHVVDAAGHK